MDKSLFIFSFLLKNIISLSETFYRKTLSLPVCYLWLIWYRIQERYAVFYFHNLIFNKKMCIIYTLLREIRECASPSSIYISVFNYEVSSFPVEMFALLEHPFKWEDCLHSYLRISVALRHDKTRRVEATSMWRHTERRGKVYKWKQSV